MSQSTPLAFTALLLLVLSLGIITTATLAYRFYRTPATRFAPVVSLLVGFTALILALLVLLWPFLKQGHTPHS